MVPPTGWHHMLQLLYLCLRSKIRKKKIAARTSKKWGNWKLDNVNSSRLPQVVDGPLKSTLICNLEICLIIYGYIKFSIFYIRVSPTSNVKSLKDIQDEQARQLQKMNKQTTYRSQVCHRSLCKCAISIMEMLPLKIEIIFHGLFSPQPRSRPHGTWLGPRETTMCGLVTTSRRLQTSA